MLLKGWAKEVRLGKKVGFIHISDGIKPPIQVVISGQLLEESRGIAVGTSLEVEGTLVDSIGPKQSQEVQASSIKILGKCDPTEYPIQKKDTSFEFLRTVPHLRTRTDTFQAIFRLRSYISQEIHRYLGERDFMWVHSPIITGSDCEGAGEMFEVSSPSTEDFFGQMSGLTVSGQLEVETFACAFSKVYSFGPTFRAEDSHTARHASEFWMLEPEIAFAELPDIMELAEKLIKHLICQVLGFRRAEVIFLREKFGLTLEELEKFVIDPFERISHDEAQDILVASGKEFQFPIGRGESLQAEHEKYLCEHFAGPVFVTDYPRLQKAFYMKASEDRSTVRCMDLLFPRIGEIIGGSQREDDYEKLEREMIERGIAPESLQWYLDLRKFGTVPHAGFGLGLERFLMWITGVANIRDAIPYPRVPGKIY